MVLQTKQLFQEVFFEYLVDESFHSLEAIARLATHYGYECAFNLAHNQHERDTSFLKQHIFYASSNSFIDVECVSSHGLNYFAIRSQNCPLLLERQLKKTGSYPTRLFE